MTRILTANELKSYYLSKGEGRIYRSALKAI